MLRYILRKLLLIIPTVVGITICAFAFVRVLPGDPILALAGENGVSPERYAILREQFGFNLPIWEQYFRYVGNALRGDFGTSIATHRPVITEFLTLFPATVELSLCAVVLAILLGIPAGIFAAVKRGTWLDQALMGTALVGYSMPIFWWGLLLIIFFSGFLGWTPVSGRIGLQFFYLSGVLKSWLRAAGFATLLTALYGVLYLLLKSENNALLMDSLLLFGILAAIMWVTRKVDWYALGTELR